MDSPSRQAPDRRPRSTRVVLVVALVLLVSAGAAFVLGGGSLWYGSGKAAPSQGDRPVPQWTPPVLEGQGRDEIGRSDRASSSVDTVQGPVLSGLVVDEEGKAVAGARVSLWTDPGVSAVTDAEGRYSLRVPPGDEQAWWLRVSTDDAGRVAREARQWVSVGLDARLVLGRAGKIHVTVHDVGTSLPVVGALVRSIAGDQVSEDSDWARRARFSDESRTDAAGGAVVKAPHGITQVHVTARGYAGVATAPAHLSESPQDVRVVLQPAGTIVGRVLDPSGVAVVGARVHAVADPIFDAVLQTDGAGAFRLEDVPAGKGRVVFSVQADGWAPGAWSTEAPEPGTTRTTEVVLQKPRTLTGRALLSDGQPAVGLRVYAKPGSTEWFRAEYFGEEPAIAVSGADGSFRLEPVAPGVVDVESRRPDGWHFASVRHAVPASGPVPEIVLRQSAGGARGAEVRVLDAAGTPMGGVSVDALTRAPDGENFNRVGWADTDHRGIARFASGLPEGPVIFVAEKKGRVAPCRIEVDLRSPRDGELVIRLPAGRIGGRVRTVAGDPARVELVCERLLPDGTPDEWMYSALFLHTDAEGGFEIEGLGDASYSLSPWGAGELALVGPASFRAQPSQLEWTIAPRESTLAAIDLRDARTRDPLLHARVTIVGQSARFKEEESPPGRYRSPPIAAGRYDLAVKMKGLRTALLRGVALAPGATAEEHFVALEVGGVLEGRVLLRGTKQPVDASLAVGGNHLWAEKGVFRVTGLDPGPAEVLLDGQLLLRTTQQVVIKGEGPTRVDFEVDPAGAILLKTREPHPEWEQMELSYRVVGGTPSRRERHMLNWDPLLENMLTSIGGLAPGRYQLEGTIDSKHFLREVEVVLGQVAEVVMDSK